MKSERKRSKKKISNFYKQKVDANNKRVPNFFFPSVIFCNDKIFFCYASEGWKRANREKWKMLASAQQVENWDCCSISSLSRATFTFSINAEARKKQIWFSSWEKIKLFFCSHHSINFILLSIFQLFACPSFLFHSQYFIHFCWLSF